MKRGEKQKVVDKGSKNKVIAFITLIFPSNGIKFTTSKTRKSIDFKTHLKSINLYVRKGNVKRFILVIDNTSFHVSKTTKQFIESSL